MKADGRATDYSISYNELLRAHVKTFAREHTSDGPAQRVHKSYLMTHGTRPHLLCVRAPILLIISWLSFRIYAWPATALMTVPPALCRYSLR